MTEIDNPPSRRALQKKLQAVVSRVTVIVISCGLLMWSVFNFWLNILAYRASEKPDQAWSITFLLVIVTCVVPFLIGLALLFKSTANDSVRPS